MFGVILMGLLNSPLVNILTGQPINWTQAIGTPLVNPGGASGSTSTGNTVYDALTGTKAQPITASSATAQTNSGLTGYVYQALIAIAGIGIIIIGFVLLGKTDLKMGAINE